MLRSGVHSNYKKETRTVKIFRLFFFFRCLSGGPSITAIKKVYYCETGIKAFSEDPNSAGLNNKKSQGTFSVPVAQGSSPASVLTSPHLAELCPILKARQQQQFQASYSYTTTSREGTTHFISSNKSFFFFFRETFSRSPLGGFPSKFISLN